VDFVVIADSTLSQSVLKGQAAASYHGRPGVYP
jgi:hypothetical protein